MRTIPHWINGQEVVPTSGNFGPVFDPSTGEQQAQVGLASVTAEMDSPRLRHCQRQLSLPGAPHRLSREGRDFMFRFRELVVAHRH